MNNQVNQRLRVALLVSEYWHNILGDLVQADVPIGTDYAFYIVSRIEAALEGETDPTVLGLDDIGAEALKVLLDTFPKRSKIPTRVDRSAAFPNL